MLTALAAFLALSPAVAQKPAGPADFFPAHTYFYLQVNPFASVDGFKGLKLAKLLDDPTLGDLFAGLLRSIPRDQDPREMLKRYPFDKAIGQHLGAGLVGFVGKKGERTYRFPQDGGLPADFFRGGANLNGSSLLAIEIEDEALFRKTVMRLLVDMLGEDAPRPEQTTHQGVDLEVWPTGGPKLYTTFAGGYCLVGQHAQDVVDAIAQQRAGRASLATRSDLRRFAKHRGADATAGFLHLGLDSAVQLFTPLLPARDRAEIEMWGGFDFSGIQLGMGFHDGGICEWMHLAFAENPKGLFMNLARLWPSVGYVEATTKRGTVYGASMTFDFAALYSATLSLMDLFGVDKRDFERDMNGSVGMDFRDDLMAAFGTNFGAVALIPNMGVIPELSLVFKVRNRKKMEAVLDRLKHACRENGVRLKDFNVSGAGAKATYLDFGKDVPLKPAFVMRGDHLVVSAMPLMLKYAVRKDRKTNKRIVDYVPDASSIDAAANFAYFYDPAPMAENVYADLLKLLDSSGRGLPFDATDLPSPEFVAAALSKFGVRLRFDPYFIALDLHSPTGIAIPTVVGGVLAAQQQATTRTDNR